jgi:Na+-translocating ferredoxin:NAD+ oxidoreductase RnfG subunit
MWSTIIAGIIAAAATGISAGVSGSTARKAQEKQDLAVAKANKQAREDWREQMAIEEEERKKRDLRNSLQMFQNTINKSSYLKQQNAALWAGRGA